MVATDYRYRGEALLARVDMSAGPAACWPWVGDRNGKGYGRLSVRLDGRQARVGAHRVMYERFVGPIPEGLTIDHLCRNKVCVNPAHLEPVTNLENNRRGVRRRTHCQRGHRFAETAVVFADGRRRCGACIADGERKAA